MTIDLSLLVPHFNDPAGLRATLASIEAQTWTGSLEVLVCDDASEPAVQPELDRIAEEHAPVRLVRNRVNRGRAETRNRLMDEAAGAHIAWCDSGDELYPDKLEQQLAGLRAAAAGDGGTAPTWAVCNYDMHWLGRPPSPRRQRVDGDPRLNLLQASLRAYLFTVLGTAESFRNVGRFDSRLPRLEDLDFFLRFVAKGGRFVPAATDAPLCVYHKTDEGKSGAEVVRCFKLVYDKHAPVLMSYSRKFRRNLMGDLYLQAARYTQNNHQHLRTAFYLGRAAVASPRRFAYRMIKSRGRL